MATPKVGGDGRRRLSVSFTLFDDDADVLWAVAHAERSSTSKSAREFVVEVLAGYRDDPAVAELLRCLDEAREERSRWERERRPDGRPNLRLAYLADEPDWLGDALRTAATPVGEPRRWWDRPVADVDVSEKRL